MTGVIVSWLTNIPLILEFNGSEVWADYIWLGCNKKRFLMGLMGWFEQRILRASALITVVSGVLKDQLIAWNIDARKIVVSENGVDTDFFDAHRASILSNLSSSKKLVVGFISTFRPWHGVNLLAELIKKSLERTLPFHFLLIGDGPLLPWLKSTLQNDSSVTYTGMLSAEKSRDYLASCDIFLCPTQPNSDGSQFFGSPTKLFEYLSLGRPVVASTVGQVRDIVYPAYTTESLSGFGQVTDEIGFLVEPDDSEGFLQALTLFSQMPHDQRMLMGAQARKKALEQYAWKTQATKILSKVALLRNRDESFVYTKNNL